MRSDAFQPKQLDLTGRWQVLHRIEKSSLSRYVGLEIEFDVFLRQDGEKVTGQGEKFVVNWQLAGRDEVSKLTLDGRVEDANIILSLAERSPKNPDRVIAGEIIWKAVNPDWLIGSFRVDAAASSGSSRAVRREPTA